LISSAGSDAKLLQAEILAELRRREPEFHIPPNAIRQREPPDAVGPSIKLYETRGVLQSGERFRNPSR
jgi:hypothetical protein